MCSLSIEDVAKRRNSGMSSDADPECKLRIPPQLMDALPVTLIGLENAQIDRRIVLKQRELLRHNYFLCMYYFYVTNTR